MNIIAITVSIISLFISAFTLIYNIVVRHKKIKINIIQHNFKKHTHLFLLSIENQSQLPISISRIVLKICDNEYRCESVSKMTEETVRKIGNQIIDRKTIYSLSMPISLSSLGGIQGYVIFEDCSQPLEIAENNVIFQVYTNRGNPIQLKVPLDN